MSIHSKSVPSFPNKIDRWVLDFYIAIATRDGMLKNEEKRKCQKK